MTTKATPFDGKTFEEAKQYIADMNMCAEMTDDYSVWRREKRIVAELEEQLRLAFPEKFSS